MIRTDTVLGASGGQAPVERDPGRLVAHAAVTDRLTGRSVAPWDGFNLGGHVGDDPGAVRSNRQQLASWVAAQWGAGQVRYMHQVHGDTVVEVGPGSSGTPAPTADAMVTVTPGVALAVLVADCVPVLLADAAAGVVGVAHAGRAGLAAGVVPATVAALRDRGATSVSALVGPSVCGRCYEVPAALRDEVAAVVPEAAATSAQGTPALDVGAGVLAQLTAAGVSVEVVPGCTREDADLYSYRRDRTTGRFAAVVALGPPR